MLLFFKIILIINLMPDDLQISQETSYQPKHDYTNKASPSFRGMFRPVVHWVEKSYGRHGNAPMSRPESCPYMTV